MILDVGSTFSNVPIFFKYHDFPEISGTPDFFKCLVLLQNIMIFQNFQAPSTFSNVSLFSNIIIFWNFWAPMNFSNVLLFSNVMLCLEFLGTLRFVKCPKGPGSPGKLLPRRFEKGKRQSQKGLEWKGHLIAPEAHGGYAPKYVPTYIHIQTHLHVYIYMHTYTCMYRCSYAHVHVYKYIYIYL